MILKWPTDIMLSRILISKGFARERKPEGALRAVAKPYRAHNREIMCSV